MPMTFTRFQCTIDTDNRHAQCNHQIIVRLWCTQAAAAVLLDLKFFIHSFVFHSISLPTAMTMLKLNISHFDYADSLLFFPSSISTRFGSVQLQLSNSTWTKHTMNCVLWMYLDVSFAFFLVSFYYLRAFCPEGWKDINADFEQMATQLMCRGKLYEDYEARWWMGWNECRKAADQAMVR